MSFSEIVNWDLAPVSAGLEALAKRSDGLTRHNAVVRGAPGLSSWSGTASDQARALAAKHAEQSDEIASQAKSLIAPLSDYLANGQALKTEAENLVAEAAAHGFEIGPDGSVASARPQSGFYAKVVAKQLADKAAQILEKDGQLQQILASAVRGEVGVTP